MELLHIDEKGIICPICKKCGNYQDKELPQKIRKNIRKVAWTCPMCGTKNLFEVNRRFGSRRKEYGKMAKIRSQEKEIPILIDDLSTGGLSFRRKIGVNAGDKLMLLFPVDFRKNIENLKVPVRIEIVSVSQSGRCGAKFLNLDEETKKKIGFWLMVA
ncbi:MAG: hypothetical protein UR60_C0048G0002 [Candidatus Moranbacteria bacterium GW2011_GWF2_34_56]|nr:MAG: hypothetical protein UR51_C0002G0028 [Candidatus Moranbacteria bacterium GW2011_GWF1_34_10]KKP63188.1 MAG: hypothetical protein UR60_C0048G0002 [Candidatus Moranbacteria bacterium GW2011_GWF2_34_56]HBI16993.1 hypothetical protein [Candidatus Moranbacteria bacterium]